MAFKSSAQRKGFYSHKNQSYRVYYEPQKKQVETEKGMRPKAYTVTVNATSKDKAINKADKMMAKRGYKHYNYVAVKDY